ncbi:MAG: DMT family transporter [Filimonas sp.]|nr:DMT family transporter [Filimonas sp.]
MNRKYLYIILLVLGTAFWGISFPVTKMAMGSVSQSTFLFYRFLLATIVLSIVLFKHVKKINRKALTGGIMLAIPLTFGIHLQTLGIKHTSASQCAFVAGMTVVIIPILKLLVYKTTVDLKIWLAAIIALAGLFIISVTDSLSISVGDLYTIIGAIGFAVYLIKVEQYNESGDILPTIVPMFATCALITLCMAVTDSKAEWLPRTQDFWVGIGYCALFSTAYMYTVSNVSQRYIRAEKVAIIYLFEPVFAAIAAMIILNEHLTWRLVAGGLLIFIGTLIPEINFRKKLAES